MPVVAKLVGIGLQVSILCLVAAIGMRSRWSDVMYLLERPVMFAKTILARNVLVPATALLLVNVYAMHPAVRAAILVISITGVPPILPASELKAGARQPFVISLLTTQTLLAIPLIPLTLTIFNAILGTDAEFLPRHVVPIVVKLTLAPLALGMIVSYASHGFATKCALVLGKVGQLLLVGGVIVIGVLFWHPWLALIGNGTLLSLALMIAAGLMFGHALGGPRHDDRTSLARAAASSHPGLAVAIVAGQSKPGMRVDLIVGAVLLYLVVYTVITRFYTFVRRDLPSDIVWRAGGDRRSVARNTPDRRRALDTSHGR